MKKHFTKHYFSTVLLFTVILTFFSKLSYAQYDEPGNGNPIVPGYFADPTIKKFGDTWYLYATTDGIQLAAGEPQVWVSKDFENWTNYKFELPDLTTVTVWAPDVVEGPDGRYYYYYSSCLGEVGGCNIYGYVSDNPIGPWESLTTSGEPVINSTFYDPVIPLDPHVFKDDDGSYYVYFCTWATYDGNGVGWAKMNEDMKSFSDRGMIPNTQLPDVFEAPFMMKKDDVYYLSYSAGSTHDGTYRVMYATSSSPTGDFTEGANSPITITNSDATIEAPGHHSFFQDGEDYYIAYHRHDNPHSTGGLVRQVCVDKLTFSGSAINKVDLTHTGIGALGENEIPQENQAYLKSASASSYYTDEANEFSYLPTYAVDNNNGTLWKAGSVDMGEYLQIDLGSEINVKRILTEFEFPTYYYQYKIEVSSDGEGWSMYADQMSNRKCGSPMLDDGDALARYIRITVTGVQKTGLLAAIWNVRVFSETSDFAIIENEDQQEGPAIFTRGKKVLSIAAAASSSGQTVSEVENDGDLGGTFTATGTITVEDIDNRRAYTFEGSQYFTFSQRTPDLLTWNSPFTVATWVYNPTVAASECLISWADRGGPLGTYAAVNYGTNVEYGVAAHWEYPDMGFTTVPAGGEWHHIVVTFDGGVERAYVDGELDGMEQKYLYVHDNGTIYIGYSGDAVETLTASIASLDMYDYALSEEAIKELYEESGCSVTTVFPQIKLKEGQLIDTRKVAVSTDTKVKLHPEIDEEETDTGLWEWAGPNGFAATDRDVEFASLTSSDFGEYTVTYTNECDLISTQIFTIEEAGSSLPEGFEACNGDCNTYGAEVNVAYGTSSDYFIVYNIEEFECSATYFGDPAPGEEKSCFIEYVGAQFDGNIAVFAESSTSFVSSWESLSGINDGLTPSSSTDRSADIYGNWDSANQLQWVQYDWDQAYYMETTDVYWFTDNGGLLMPTEAYVEYWDGSAWVHAGDIGANPDEYNELDLSSIYTDELRLSMINDEQSVGIIEWRVYGSLDSSSDSDNDDEVLSAEQLEGSFLIYPNPSGAEFNIQVPDFLTEEAIEIEVLDTSGKQVYSSEFQSGTGVSISKHEAGLEAGIYVVSFRTKNYQQTQRLVVH